MNNPELEDIIFNKYFKDYDKQEIYKIIQNLSKHTYKNQGQFNIALRKISKGQRKLPSKSIFYLHVIKN